MLIGQDPAPSSIRRPKDHFRTLEPGVTVGGPIMKDRLWFFAGFEPLVNTEREAVDFGSQNGNAGNQYFTQDRQTYYSTVPHRLRL